MSDVATVDAAMGELDQFRGELTGYCYRMLGSTYDADDAVQETMVRAWRGLESFEGRAALRSWLYRIATNVCLDALRSRQRRALPMDLSSPLPAAPDDPGPILPESTWIEPMRDAEVIAAESDPAERAVRQESIRLAFVAALQHLPPKQRAVLILREVLAWQASEVAELLDTTVASVNSALQRARGTLAEVQSGGTPESALTESDRELLARYVSAFEAYDIDRLVGLLHEDGSISMPPFTMWLQGREVMPGFYLGAGAACRGSHLVPLVLNGLPAFAHYKPTGDGRFTPWALQVLEVDGGHIRHIHHFLDTTLFERFGLPAEWAA